MLLCGDRFDMSRSPRTGGPLTGQVEAIEVHHLVPRPPEVMHELLLRVVLRVDRSESAELGVRPEAEIDRGRGPPPFARKDITARLPDSFAALLPATPNDASA